MEFEKEGQQSGVSGVGVSHSNMFQHNLTFLVLEAGTAWLVSVQPVAVPTDGLTHTELAADISAAHLPVLS